MSHKYLKIGIKKATITVTKTHNINKIPDIWYIINLNKRPS